MSDESTELYKTADCVRVIEFNSSGSKLAIGCGKNIHIWCGFTLEKLNSVQAHSVDIIDIKFTHNDSHIITQSRAGMLRFWDSTTLKQVAKGINRINVSHIAISPDSTMLALYNSPSSSIELFSIPDYKLITSLINVIKYNQSPMTMEFGHDNTYIIITEYNYIYGINIKTKESMYEIRDNRPTIISSSHNGRYLIKRPHANPIQILKINPALFFQTQVIAEILQSHYIIQVFLTKDTTKLVMRSSHHVLLYDIVEQKIVNDMAIYHRSAIALSPDNSILVYVAKRLNNHIQVMYNPFKKVSGSITKMALKSD